MIKLLKPIKDTSCNILKGGY